MGPREVIDVAYCIPYLYSHLLNDIKHFRYVKIELEKWHRNSLV